MHLFLSDEEFQRQSHDASLVADKADVFIRELYNQLETVKAEADAAVITAEQTCSGIEQKYVALTAELSSLQSQLSELTSTLDKRDSEFGQLQSDKQQLLLQSVEKDGDIERLKLEGSELHKSKRQLMEMLEQKDMEISEKNATIKSYLDKIVNLNEIGASKEAHQGDLESELARLNATSSRLLQEKELLERHNSWLNEELTAKVDNIIQLRKANGELEADMSSKLADAVNECKLSSDSLKLHKDRVKELEGKLVSMEEELLSAKEAAAAAEQRFTAEISTVTKLLDLYKESSNEWSKKAGELEGVIKALETHLNQVENEYKEKLEKEEYMKKHVEQESADLKEKLQICEAELERLRKENELKHLPLSGFTANSWVNLIDNSEMVENDRAIVPRIPGGVSGTALAASLLRDGWSLATMYAKYQEATDALHHEELGRKQTQAILERVLYEIEEKAGVIMDEREEHERLVEAYTALDQKMQHSLSEHSALETTIRELKANLKWQEREGAVAQQEIVELQKQVAVLLKECRDVQLRCGSVAHDDDMITVPMPFTAGSDAESIISMRLLTFKDINGLVEQNSQLRSLARDLSQQIEKKEAELKEEYEIQLQKHKADTASKVNSVLLRAEEHRQMIESLHASVAMYKKLYEEGELKLRSAYHLTRETAPELGSQKVIQLRESSLESSFKAQEHAFERVKSLEEELSKSKTDLISLRAQCDNLSLEAQFAKEKLARFMEDFRNQREEHNKVIARNVEFSQLIVDYQRKIRESSDSLNASYELSRKLTMEVSILKHEKEILQNSEKRAFDEVRSLSERVHRLQASLDTMQCTEEAREEAKGIERRKHEEYVKKIEREWAEAKREVQEERENARNFALERENTLNNAFRQVEESRKELASALQSVAAAESRAAVAEARCSDLKNMMEPFRVKDSDIAEGDASSSASEKILANLREEIENLRGEVQSSKDHMLQYKSIAQVNEAALKQMESAHENFRTEANDARKSLEAELLSLQERVKELENECKLKTEEAISASAGKEEALLGALSEISSLKEDCSVKMSQILLMESQVSNLKEELEQEHQRWLTAQANYERQVILQSETIKELTKTSQALASSQDAASELRKLADVLKNENNELKSNWETEKLAVEVYKNVADNKYNEVNELNKILHSHLEALHIKSAEKERALASGSMPQTSTDDGLQNVVKYLRRSKEIAETEISLLKQEKLRLQSQLESALKSSQAAQTSLQSERAKSRSSLFTEEEFKSLQLQVRELTLLRESNAQLREENRHNFEECKKLRETFQKDKNEIGNLENLLRNRETDLEACRKEIDVQKLEKVHLEKRVNELVEKCSDVDVNDYNRLKESFQLLQLNFKEKDVQIEELKKSLSEKQDAASHLEQDLAISRTELIERDTRISELLQSETSLKSEAEKQRRSNIQARRKFENQLKEKEDQNKEMQSQFKQLEDAKQAKRNLGDSAVEQALREKEKEKDTRIQILERTLERHREELRKEKEDHQKEKEKSQKIRKTIIDSREIVTQQKIKLTGELRNHKEALRALQDEVEKLKSSGGSRSESTSVAQPFSNSLLDDTSSVYFQAVENFEQVAQPACDELEPPSTKDAPAPPSLDNTSTVGAPMGQTAGSLTLIPAASTSNIVSRAVEERERILVLGKANVRTGRKLVRPNIMKPKEPQGDVDMSEADEINPMLSSQNVETQENPTLPTVPLVRKRPSASTLSDVQEDMLTPAEASSDMAAPAVKKSKASESLPDGGEEKPTSPSKLIEVVLTEESPDDVVNFRHSVNEELVDSERDEFENVGEQVEEPPVEQIQAGLASEAAEVADEKLDKPSESVQSHEQLRDQIEQDIQKIITESGSDMEEGEMVADLADNDGDSYISNEMGYPEPGELQAEQSVEPENSPGMEPFVPATFEIGGIDPPPTPEEKNDGGDVTENIVEISDKHNDGVDPGGETEQFSGPVTTTNEEASTSNYVDTVASEQGGPTPTQDIGGKPVSPLNSSSTTINLQERARQRAHLRQAGMITSTASRARGRVARGRGVRGGRTGRGQSPG